MNLMCFCPRLVTAGKIAGFLAIFIAVFYVIFNASYKYYRSIEGISLSSSQVVESFIAVFITSLATDAIKGINQRDPVRLTWLKAIYIFFIIRCCEVLAPVLSELHERVKDPERAKKEDGDSKVDTQILLVIVPISSLLALCVFIFIILQYLHISFVDGTCGDIEEGDDGMGMPEGPDVAVDGLKGKMKDTVSGMAEDKAKESAMEAGQDLWGGGGGDEEE